MADSSTTGDISLDCDFFGNFCKCVKNHSVNVIIIIVSAICWILKGTEGNDKRWIENEKNLLCSLEGDVKEVLDSGSPIYNEALTLWLTEEHNQEKRARLKDSEEKWREKNKTLVAEVDSLIRKINYYKEIFKSDDLVFCGIKMKFKKSKAS